MRRTYRKKKWKPDKSQFRANERIRVPEIRLIDEDGNARGVVNTKEALAEAQEKGFDLIEVNPKAQPPIAKFADFGKLQYEKEKLKQKQKAKLKKVETKGIRMSFRISDHDLGVRLKQANKFLDKGHKLKIELTMRGRENAYKDEAVAKVLKFIEDIKEQRPDDEIITEQYPKKQGGRISTVIAIKTKK